MDVSFYDAKIAVQNAIGMGSPIVVFFDDTSILSVNLLEGIFIEDADEFDEFGNKLEEGSDGTVN